MFAFGSRADGGSIYGMKTALALLVILAASPAFAAAPDDTTDALRRLQERQAAREAAATQPTTLTAAQVDALRAEIRRLQAENAELRKQIAARVPTPKPAAPAAGNEPAVTWKTRAKTSDEPGKPNPYAVEMDKKIAAYLEGHKVSDEVAKAMYEGRPAIGMPEDALKLIASNYRVESETERSKNVALVIYDFKLHTGRNTPVYRATIEDGKVVLVQNPY